MSEPLVKIEKLTIEYNSYGKAFKAVDDVSMDIYENEKITGDENFDNVMRLNTNEYLSCWTTRFTSGGFLATLFELTHPEINNKIEINKRQNKE